MYKKRSLFLVIFIITLFSKTTLQARFITFYNEIKGVSITLTDLEKRFFLEPVCSCFLPYGGRKVVFISEKKGVLRLQIKGMIYIIPSKKLEGCSCYDFSQISVKYGLLKMVGEENVQDGRSFSLIVKSEKSKIKTNLGGSEQASWTTWCLE